MMVVTALRRRRLAAALLLVHALAAGRALPVRCGRAAGTAFAVTLMLALSVALMPGTSLMLAVLAMALRSGRLLRGGGAGDRDCESRYDVLHGNTPEKAS